MSVLVEQVIPKAAGCFGACPAGLLLSGINSAPKQIDVEKKLLKISATYQNEAKSGSVLQSLEDSSATLNSYDTERTFALPSQEQLLIHNMHILLIVICATLLFKSLDT